MAWHVKFQEREREREKERRKKITQLIGAIMLARLQSTAHTMSGPKSFVHSLKQIIFRTLCASSMATTFFSQTMSAITQVKLYYCINSNNSELSGSGLRGFGLTWALTVIIWLWKRILQLFDWDIVFVVKFVFVISSNETVNRSFIVVLFHPFEFNFIKTMC